MASLESFWVVAGTAAPVIGLAHAVAIQGTYKDDRQFMAHKRILAAYAVSALSCLLCILVLDLSLVSLGGKDYSFLKWTTVVSLTIAFAGVAAVSILIAEDAATSNNSSNQQEL